MQKLKIGIFGDSFGYHYIAETQFVESLSWISLLSSEYDVTNYSVSGGSTYISYTHFIENYQKFDKIIFLITQPTRIHTSFGAITCANHAEYRRVNSKSNYQINVLIGLEGYMRVCYADPEILNQHQMFHELMIKKIKSLKHEILFIYSFSYENKIGLFDITMRDNNIWGLGDDWMNLKKDRRQCHLTESGNVWLYQKISDIIPTVQDYTTLEFNLIDVPLPDKKERYV